MILRLFWNTKEHRLRALWRIVIQALSALALNGIFVLMIGIAMSSIRLGGDLTGGTGNIPSLSTQLISALQASGWTQVMLAFINLCAILLSLLLAARFLDHRPWTSYGFHFKRDWWVDFGFGLALGGGLMALVFLTESGLGWITIVGTFQPAQTGETFWIGLAQALVLFLCVGIYEEAASRGYLLRNLAEGLNLHMIGKRNALLVGYGITTVIFGLQHIANPFTSSRSTLGIILAGLFLGLAFLLTGELAIPIGIHIAWNFFEGSFFGFQVSGTQFGSSFISIRQAGPETWTGGAFGPEAGLIGMLAVILGMGMTIAWVRRIRKKALLMDYLAEYHAPIQRGHPQ